MAAVAQIEDRQKTGAAVGTDDNAKLSDCDSADHGVSFSNGSFHRFRIGSAVRVKDMDGEIRGIDPGQIVQDAGDDLLDRILTAASLLYHIIRIQGASIDLGLAASHESRITIPSFLAASKRLGVQDTCTGRKLIKSNLIPLLLTHKSFNQMAGLTTPRK